MGLFTALLGGVSINVVRRLNTRAVQRATRTLEAGDAAALMRLHLTGIGRDAARAALVTGTGLLLAGGVHELRGHHTLGARGTLLVAATATGAALAAGTAGTVRLVGRGPQVGWFAAGLLGGVAGAWLQ